MTDLLHRIHMGKLTFDHAGYLNDPEYKALSAEEDRYLEQMEAAMGRSFTAKFLAASAAVGAYAADQDFQEGVRLGAQLVLALLEPLAQGAGGRIATPTCATARNDAEAGQGMRATARVAPTGARGAAR